MAVLRRYLWISALAFGLIFLALGAFVVVKGLAAKAEIRDRLAEEQVYTSKDAVSFGVDEGVLVQDAKTAQAQADTIRLHTLERYGPYAKMAKDDPNRATFVNGVALRGALGLAVVGFRHGHLHRHSQHPDGRRHPCHRGAGTLLGGRGRAAGSAGGGATGSSATFLHSRRGSIALMVTALRGMAVARPEAC